ncbi:hypothetical protein SAMN05216201_107111 [Pseudomonas linyingensis]|uniref:Uncharacterized protein n=1 Tax=Pseudomonas linyingensis TaxID=915471 RepID=A0A1H6XYP0_9PSED|nr:hypothetical protein [Pseudomonas linyingensis]SEJ34169.1 hypothetical protein SAMN05216201_107111 [Pseudomonas linyingensis]
MSKFLKFKQVLSYAEAIELLERLTGTPPTEDDFTGLIAHGYLTPIQGFGRPLVGFSLEQLKTLVIGDATKPLASSHIGITSIGHTSTNGISAAQVKTTENTSLYFFAVKPRGGAVFTKIEYSTDDLEPLHYSFSHEHNHYLAEEIFAVATQANNDELPSLAGPIGKKCIHINWESGDRHLFPPSVTALYGFNGASGSKSYKPSEAPPPPQENRELTDRPAHRLAVAALLDLLNEPSRNARNQSAVIAEIQERHPNRRGLSKRNLEEIFAAANKAKKEIE